MLSGWGYTLYGAPENKSESAEKPRVIKEIVISGTTHVPLHTIRHHLPYAVGQVFDPTKSKQAITSLTKLGTFEQVVIETESRGSAPADGLTLFITVTEKPLLGKIVVIGNSHLATSKIFEEIDKDSIQTIDEEIAQIVKKKLITAYKKENFHHVSVTTEIIPDPLNVAAHNLFITVDEEVKSSLQKIVFKNNEKISARMLRSVIMSRESWILGALSGAGIYNPDMIEYDKYLVSEYYKNLGYYTARVTDVSTGFSDDKKHIELTYNVTEGPRFTVSDVTIIPDAENEFPLPLLESFITLKPGEIYNHKKIHDMREELVSFFGAQGYIDADIAPHLIPNLDEKTIAIRIVIDKGKKWRLRRLNITGNTLTRDHVIRRKIYIEEGDIITAPMLDLSKMSVTQLSYFKPEGVNWKKHYRDNDMVDLELNVQEAPVRTFNAQLGFTGTESDPGKSGVKGQVDTSWGNMFGSGRDLRLKFEATAQHLLHQFSASFVDPHFLETPYSLSVDTARRIRSYDGWRTNIRPEEIVWSHGFSTGGPLPRLIGTYLNGGIGVDIISNNNSILPDGTSKIKPSGNVPEYLRAAHQRNIDDRLQAGVIGWFETGLLKDTRNHRVYPSDGYRMTASIRIAPPKINEHFSFIKTEFNSSWYTELIDQQMLVLGLHTRAGFVQELTSDTVVPYKELFFIGGANTVRGFEWGSVGPMWHGTILGGRKMIQCNAELVFPIAKENGLFGHFFYDNGASWDTPKYKMNEVDRAGIENDTFRLRHSAGFGINLMYPQAMKISFGYKLDYDKRSGEQPSKFEIMANMAF